MERRACFARYDLRMSWSDSSEHMPTEKVQVTVQCHGQGHAGELYLQ